MLKKLQIERLKKACQYIYILQEEIINLKRTEDKLSKITSTPFIHEQIILLQIQKELLKQFVEIRISKIAQNIIPNFDSKEISFIKDWNIKKGYILIDKEGNYAYFLETGIVHNVNSKK